MESNDCNTTSLLATTATFNCGLGNSNDSNVSEVVVEAVVKDEEEDCEVPCIICYCNVQDKLKNVEEEDEDKAVENDKIFQWFLLKFMVMRKKYGNQNRKVERFDELLKNRSLGWDGHGGQSSPLPFCEECKIKLIGLMEINTEEKNGKKVVVEGIQSLKRRMRACEVEFVDGGIYDKDERYHRVRRYIMKVVTGRLGRKLNERKKANRLSMEDELVVKEELEDDQGQGDIDWGWWEDEEEPEEIQVKEEDNLEDNEMVEEGPLEPDAGAGSLPHHNCLLCYKAISRKESSLAPVLTNDLLEQNLNSVFILRKMLEIPKKTLVGYLESFGCPGKWVEFCRNCLGVVGQALRIQKEISELEDKLRRCQEKMKIKIKSTYKKNWVTPTPPSSLETLDIKRVTEESRQFVVKPMVSQVVSDVGDDEGGPVGSWQPKKPSDEKKCRPVKIKVKRAKLLSATDQVQEKQMNKLVKILKGGSYTCPLCPRMSRHGAMSLAKFYSHLIFHRQRPFQCSICKLYWSGPDELGQNANPFKKNTPSNGHLCSEQTLVEVSEEKNVGKIWACEWCPKAKFTTETNRDLHEDTEHSCLKIKLEMKYKCLSCNSAYRSFQEWLLHRVLEHPKVAAISCLYCDFTTVIPTKEGIDILDGNKMSDHVNSVHSPSCRKRDVCLVPETCDFCGVACKAGTDKMKRHVKIVHKLTNGLSTYRCPCCGSRYDHLIQLRWHIMLEHEKGNEVIREAGDDDDGDEDNGHHLGLEPQSSSDLGEPTGTITTDDNKFEKILQEGSYNCPLCPNTCSLQKMSLAKFCSHLIFHKQRSFKCVVCDIHWSGVEELEKNPFAKQLPINGHVCTEATLVREVPAEGRLNMGEIWDCEWCPDKFEEETLRNLHEDRVHPTLKSQLEMEYKCLSCNLAYRSYKEWYLHRALEHPEVAWLSCLYCDYKTAIQTREGIDIPNGLEMRDHIRSMHYPVSSSKERNFKYVFMAPETCDFCGVSCRGGTEKLKRHVKNTHKLTRCPSTYSCSCCWSRYDQLTELRTHIKLEHSLTGTIEVVGSQVEKKRRRKAPQSSDNLDLDPSSDEDETSSSSPNKKAKLFEGSGEILENSGDKFVEILKKGSYTCPLCPGLNKGTMSLANFYSHLIFHSKRSYKCSLCHLYWSDPKELEKNPFAQKISFLPNAHLHHLCSEETLVKVPLEKKCGMIWNCEWCPIKFEEEKERDSHEIKEHFELKSGLEMEHVCLSCHSAYRSYKEWLVHRALEHPEVAGMSCLYCDYTVVIQTKDGIDVLNSRQMKTHVNEKHPQSGYAAHALVTPETCDFCGVPFKGSSDKLRRHVKNVHGLKSGQETYGCPCCLSRFGQLVELRGHIKLEHGLRGSGKKHKKRFHVICDVCGGMVLSAGTGKMDMVNHKLVKHGIEPEGEEFKDKKILTCEKGDECGGFRTLYIWMLREHMMKKHGAERKWKCEECGKGFITSEKLRRHTDIHKNKGARPYQCEICGNSFAVRNYLYIHMRLSHQNRPFASTNKKRVKK